MSLSESLDAVLAPEGDTTPGRFVVDGPETADWALRKLARVRARAAEAADLARRERDRITAWETAELERLANEGAYFTGLLEDWHRRVLDEEPRRKTIHLPAGDLHARKAPDRWAFDGNAFLQWAVRAGRDEFVRTPAPEVDKAAAKKALEVRDGAVWDPATGEVVDGVAVEPGEVRFSAEVGA